MIRLVFLPPPYLAPLAQIADAVIGDPDWLWRTLRHPVCWFGALLTWLEQRLNRPERSFAQRRLAGFAALFALLTLTLALTVAISWGVRLLPFGWTIEALLASTLIAQRSLHWHVAAVAKALEQEGVTAGRSAVARIVGRDPDSLDAPAICRAALESLAENFSDGVTAPVLWLAVAGLPGIALYKAINTADSMIGHRTERYRAFGWAAARLDDLVNLPASRLSGLLIALAALLMRGPDAAGRSLRAMWRDASCHRSPNAGWPEAALAGALGVRLAGPRRYGGIMVEDRWMGQGRMSSDPNDIRQGLRVFVCACWLLGGLLTLFALVKEL